MVVMALMVSTPFAAMTVSVASVDVAPAPAPAEATTAPSVAREMPVQADGADKAPVGVAIVTDNPGLLGRALQGMNARHSLGTVDRTLDQRVVVSATVPGDRLAELSALPFVYNVFQMDESVPAPESADLDEGSPAQDGDSAEGIFINDVQNNFEAWSMGYTGEGVVIGLAGPGIDFGSPDLAGTQARVEDPASPYYGWPIVYDPASIAAYLSTATDVPSETRTVIGSVSGESVFQLTESTDAVISPYRYVNSDNSPLPEYGTATGGLADVARPDSKFLNVTEGAVYLADPVYGEYRMSVRFDIEVPPLMDSWKLVLAGYSSEGAEDVGIVYSTDASTAWEPLTTVDLATTMDTFDFALPAAKMAGAKYLRVYINDTVNDAALSKEWTWDSGNVIRLIPTNTDDRYSIDFVGLETTGQTYELLTTWKIPLTAGGREWALRFSGNVQGVSEEGFEFWYDTTPEFGLTSALIGTVQGTATTDLEYRFDLDALRDSAYVYLQVRDLDRTADTNANTIVITQPSIETLSLGYYSDTSRTYETLVIAPPARQFANEAMWDAATPYPNSWVPATPGTDESFTLAGLANGRNYTICVRAVDGAGLLGPIGTTVIAASVDDSTAPARVDDLAAVPGSRHGQVVLSWTAVGDDGTAGTPDRYVVYMSELPIANRACWEYNSVEVSTVAPAASGSPMSCSIDGLVPGVARHFVVAAIDEAGNEGAFSNSAGAVVTIDTVRPSAVIDLAAVPGSNNSEIDLSWTASGDDGTAGTVDSFDLRYSTLTVWAAEPVLRPLRAATDDFVASAIENSTIYLGHGQAADEAVPWKSVSVDASRFDYSDTLVDVTWSQPSGWNTQDVAPAPAFQNKYWEEVDAADAVEGNAGANPVVDVKFLLDVENVDPASVSVMYRHPTTGLYEVMPSSGFEIASGDGTITVHTPISLAQPMLVNYTFRHFTVDSAMGSVEFWNTVGEMALDGTVSVSYLWYDPTAAPVDIALDYPYVVSGTINVTIDGGWLEEGTDFTLDEDAGVMHLATPLGPLVNVTATYSTLIPVSEANWDYLFQVLDVPVEAAGGTVEVTHTFTVGQAYNFAVRGVDDAGSYGHISNIVADVFPGVDTVAPGTITDLTVETGPDYGTVYVNFTATGGNANAGWAEVYDLRWSAAPIDEANWGAANQFVFDDPVWADMFVGTWTAPRMAGSTESFLTGLVNGNQLSWGATPGSTVHFAIKAVDKAGNSGPISPSVSAVIGDDPAAPAGITDLEAFQSKTHGRIYLTWTMPGDDANSGEIFQYIVYYSDAPITGLNVGDIYQSGFIVEGKPAGSTMNFTFQMPSRVDETVYFCVHAKDEADKESLSNVDSAIVYRDVTPPSAVSDLAVGAAGDDRTVSLTWTAPGNDGATRQATGYLVRYLPNFNHHSYIKGLFDAKSVSNKFIHFEKELQGGSVYTTYEETIWPYVNKTVVLDAILPSGTKYLDSVPAGNLTADGTTLWWNFTNAAPGVNTIEIRYLNVITVSFNVPSFQATYSVTRTLSALLDDGMFYDGSTTYDGVGGTLDPLVSVAAGDITWQYTNISAGAYVIEMTYLQWATNAFYVKVGSDLVLAPYKVYGAENTTVDTLSSFVYATAQGELERFVAGEDFVCDMATGRIVLLRDYDAAGTYRISYGYRVSFNITGTASRSGVVHVGTHPDANLAAEFDGRYPRIVLFDPLEAGEYDSVVVDVDFDNDFSDENPATKGSESVNQDTDGDGYADASGGMIYFIARSWSVSDEALTADGATIQLAHAGIVDDSLTLYSDGSAVAETAYTVDAEDGVVTLASGNEGLAATALTADYEWGVPIPASAAYAADNGLVNRIPRNGDLVAFMGEFDAGSVTGTIEASNIVGQGRVPYNGDTDFMPAIGGAPDAKLMTIRTYGTDGWMFAIEGYDGVSGTGDEADVFPYTSQGAAYNSGWDGTARYLDYVFHDLGGDRTVVAASSGMPGSGYGQVGSPGGAPSVITFGVGTSMYYRERERYESGPNPCGGEIMPGSGKGPSMLGNPEPDAISVGAFAYCSPPLYDAGSTGNWLNNGPSVSVCTGAAGLAVVYQAYADDNNGSFPSATQARRFVMSGARDLGQDVLAQGAGFIDVAQASRLAGGVGGVVVSPEYWVPGDYAGQLFEAFPKFIGDKTLPENLDREFAVENAGSSAATATVEALVLDKFAQSSAWGETGPGITETGYGSGGGNGWLILSENGIYNHDGSFLGGVDTAAWNSASMMRVIVTCNWTTMDTNGDGALDYDYWMELFNWTDVNDNGKADGHNYDAGSIEFFAYNERNRKSPALTSGTTYWEARVQQPSKWAAEDGLLLWFRNLGSDQVALDFKVTLEFYEKTEWDWLDIDDATLSIPAKGTATFNATCAVPDGTPVGSYEGGVYVTCAGKTTVVPILVNVAASTGSLTFGQASDISQDLYNNTRVNGDNDWRFFFMDIPQEGMFESFGDNTKLIMDLGWSGEKTDIDLFAFASVGGADLATAGDQARYGPYALSNTGGSTESSLAWMTSTGGTEEIATASLAPGLVVVGARTVRLDGQEPYSTLSDGKAGLITLSTAAISLATNQRYSSTSLGLTSNVGWKGLGAIAAGPSAPVEYPQFVAAQDDPDWSHFDSFESQLASGGNIITVDVSSSALILDVRISSLSSEFAGETCNDLDLGVFLDRNLDGRPTVDEFVAYDADGDAEEHVKLVQPEAGRYLVVIYGFTVPATGEGKAHVYLTLVQGEGFSVSGATDAYIAANSQMRVGLGWTLDGSQDAAVLQGALAVGPKDAPLAMLIPVEINFQPYGAPVVTSASIVGVPEYTDADPELVFMFSDAAPGVDKEAVAMSVDGVDVTGDCIISESLAKYSAQGLADGAHIVRLVLADLAGNTAEEVFSFSVDTNAPMLFVDGPSVAIVKDASYAYSGWSDAASVAVFVDEAPVELALDGEGNFAAEIPLASEGVARDVRVEARDTAGNLNTLETKVYLDQTTPVFADGRAKIDTLSTSGSSARVFGAVDALATNEHGAVSVAVNGVEAPIRIDGTFEARVLLANEGDNVIGVVLSDEAGNTRTQTFTVARDTTAPTLALDNPPASDVTESAFVLSGDLAGTARRQVLVNGERVSTDAEGHFEKTFDLNPGMNVIVVQAEDELGNTAEVRVSVNYEAHDSVNEVTVPSEPSGQSSTLAIVLMVLLLVAGLVLGAVAGFAGAGFFGGKGDGGEGGSEPAPPAEGPAPEGQAPPQPPAQQ